MENPGERARCARCDFASREILTFLQSLCTAEKRGGYAPPIFPCLFLSTSLFISSPDNEHHFLRPPDRLQSISIAPSPRRFFIATSFLQTKNGAISHAVSAFLASPFSIQVPPACHAPCTSISAPWFIYRSLLVKSRENDTLPLLSRSGAFRFYLIRFSENHFCEESEREKGEVAPSLWMVHCQSLAPSG